VQIVGEAANGQDAIRCVREVAPDVVVMDLNMPGMSGVDATREITSFAPLTRVVVLTISDQDDDVMDAIVAGACGYLVKDSSIQELIRGITSAAVGESLISPPIAAKVLQRVRAVTLDQGAERIRAELSERELEVLRLIANGKDNSQIAEALHISPKTVKNHISNILMKLQIGTSSARRSSHCSCVSCRRLRSAESFPVGTSCPSATARVSRSMRCSSRRHSASSSSTRA
jgi:DNA-binding NarL/FixJ family response regulator